jgi:hypothetical protein
MFAQRSQEAVAVRCPARVVPDGGEQTCTVDLMSGERLAVTVARRGGDHRVTSVAPLEPSSP